MLYLRLLLSTLVASTRTRRDLVLENLALRHQLAVYARQRSKPAIARGDRRLWSLLARTWAGWRHPLVIVRPATVVRWHRSAWRAHWRRKSRRRGPVDRGISREIQQLITRLARESTWREPARFD